MDEFVELLKNFNVVNIAVVCVSTTLVVSLINTVENKIHDGWLVVGIGFGLTVLRTQFVEGMSWSQWQDLIFQFIVTVSVAYLFTRKYGQWFTERLFGFISKYVDAKFNRQEKKNEDSQP